MEELRSLVRRARAGSPEVRWDIARVTDWLAAHAQEPPTAHSPRELDDLEEFVLSAVAEGTESPEDGREVFTAWLGLM